MPLLLPYFYPRSPCGERPHLAESESESQNISIHALLAESDIMFVNLRVMDDSISIHALLAESDLIDTQNLCVCVIFLSTLSLRRATQTYYCENSPQINFYPRSPCGERRPRPQPPQGESSISIHALLAESDRRSRKPCHLQTSFLSTLSLRRATRL